MTADAKPLASLVRHLNSTQVLKIFSNQVRWPCVCSDVEIWRRSDATLERLMENRRVRLIIEGRVQGVWFRESTRRQAMALGVTGWVRNRPDGSVELVAEGNEGQVQKLLAWCHQGPSAARVARVHEHLEAWQGEFDSFEITY